MAGAAEFRDVQAVVVRLHDRGEGSALAQWSHIACGRDVTQHDASIDPRTMPRTDITTGGARRGTYRAESPHTSATSAAAPTTASSCSKRLFTVTGSVDSRSAVTT